MDETGGWSGLIQGLITDASKGYIYEKYGYANSGGQSYFKGQDGATYEAGRESNATVAKTVSSYTPYIIGAVALLAVVMVMD